MLNEIPREPITKPVACQKLDGPGTRQRALSRRNYGVVNELEKTILRSIEMDFPKDRLSFEEHAETFLQTIGRA